MGLFNKKSKISDDINGIDLLDKYKNGVLDEQTFLNSFGKVKIFYSTPFGDHINGEQRVFLIPAQDDTGYLPVFTSTERAEEFYKKMGRIGFIIMEDYFVDFLKTTRKINQENTPIPMGALIEPEYYGITINATALNGVINMMA